MKTKEIINEGMSFHAVKQEDHPKFGKVWSSKAFEINQMVRCWLCHGKGKDQEGNRCDVCDGKKFIKEPKSRGPELNVSNSNGYLIQKMLGLEPDYSGIITHDRLPTIMQQLIRLKNSNQSQYVQDPTTAQPKMRVSKDPETGLTKIGKGPTMIDMGVSESQITRYIDTLIDLVKFAQQNDASIGWG